MQITVLVFSNFINDLAIVVKDVWIVLKSAGWKVIDPPHIRLFFNSILKNERSD
jgi:hypothetical protein